MKRKFEITYASGLKKVMMLEVTRTRQLMTRKAREEIIKEAQERNDKWKTIKYLD